ncbi:MAG TPA: ribosomal protein S18-alanine N-acetyltransferase [Candidatus Limivivens merdigallinarum]|uniref:[Ribosomal protein bS18]-alanine N-acetyltransferase n=1 Tax=Candidatus Limivivens merdigallinarum TaxID=2840859 RepID=A0A9D1D231_9FIRM|nr:ribosomal protein S18-alanine N-acetyltransferase [Candidatus Limivivens merdigallinarum]
MLTVRQMEEADLGSVARIEASIFSKPWSEEGFRDSLKLPNTVYLVAEQDGSIAGYIGMLCVLDEGEITNVAVAEGFRRQGIGERLLSSLLQAGRKEGVDSFTLEVRESNSSARRLYRKLGFQEEGIRKNFYEKPTEDAILMWKRF